MKILAIETSCDETAISILDCEKDKVNILAHEINSQIEIHKEYGGVFPSLARREHGKNCVPVLDTALEKAKLETLPFSLTENLKIKLKEILEREPALFELLIPFLEKTQKPNLDAIAVTEGPGLEPALWVGIVFSKALSLAWDLPIISVNHMEGHIVSALLEDTEKETGNIQKITQLDFPAISLLVSGGHTELVKINSIGDYEAVGITRDDAVGEAFDKVARILGYPYPGGPEISRLAEKARLEPVAGSQESKYKLPRPMLHSPDLDFSFSGIKTAVLYMTQKIKDMTEEIKMQIAKEFEDAVVEVLVSKTKKAIEKYNAKTLVVGGGVIANKKLREDLLKNLPDINVLIPHNSLTTDNATMIGVAGYLRINRSNKGYSKDLHAQGGMTLTKA